MTNTPLPDIRLPDDLRPSDGRFGCGPSKVWPDAVAALAATGSDYLGTSHRRAGVRSVVHSIREGLGQLFSLPEGYEVLLGNGGTTLFWDAATFGLIESRSQHLSFGEFSSKFAKAAKSAPHLRDPEVIESPTGTHPAPKPAPDIDAYALTHNETSTGVMMPIERPDADGLVLVDATSGAGGLAVDPAQFDVYYFAPQKCFASDGGLWLALCSPTAIERIERIASSGRFVPAILDLRSALDNSRQDQTLNTPALATLFLLDRQLQWMLGNGGMPFTTGRCDHSASIVYGWADKADYAEPFVAESDERSHVVATIDLAPPIDAPTVSNILRANGIVDTESYRKLGRNQLRIAMFPAIEPDDLERLTRAIDHIVAALG